MSTTPAMRLPHARVAWTLLWASLLLLGGCAAEQPDFTRIKAGVVRVLTADVSGSGFIVTGDGYVVTNCHVVDKANGPVRIMLREGGDFQQADIVAVDSRRDLALLRIQNGSGLTPIPLAAASDVAAGQQVWALGFPGIAEAGMRVDAQRVIKISSGVVSAVVANRAGVASLQTDAEIFPGSSGGPLVNKSGALVGVTAWEYSKFTPRLGLLEKANYAISVTEVRAFLSAHGVAGENPGWVWTPLEISIAALTALALGLLAAWLAARRRRAAPMGENAPPPAAPHPSPAVHPGTPALLVVSGPGAGTSFTLTRGVQDIGRDARHTAIAFASPRVSRRHARITYSGEDFILLEDLDSTNGVYVNGQRIVSPVRIAAGGEFSLAGNELRLRFSLR